MAHYAVIMVTRDTVQSLELCSSLEAVRAARDSHRALHRGEDCHIAAIYGELDGQMGLKRNRFRVIS